LSISAPKEFRRGGQVFEASFRKLAIAFERSGCQAGTQLRAIEARARADREVEAMRATIKAKAASA